MHIYEFINLIQNAFSNQIQPDPKTGKISAKQIYQDVITWFTDESLMDIKAADAISKISLNYCEKILNESNEIDMPIWVAKILKSKVTSVNFTEIYDAADLTFEAEKLLLSI